MYYESNAAAGDASMKPDGWPALLVAGDEAEHRATRTTAGLFDETSFAKIEIRGPDAAAFLDWICDNHVARDVDNITYTQLLNSRGGIDSDFTVTRLGAEPLLGRDGHCVRQPRRRLATQASQARRRRRIDRRRDRPTRLLRAVGSGGTCHPRVDLAV